MEMNQKIQKEEKTIKYKINNQILITTNKKNNSTAIPLSNKFHQTNLDNEVNEFTEQLPCMKHETPNPQLIPYQKWNLIKDVNYLNTIFNHILIMISSNLNKLGDSKNYQIVKMRNQIQRIIMENIKLKEEIDRAYQNMNNLQELSDYLRTNLNDIINGKLQVFLNDFQNKQRQVKTTSLQLQKMRGSIKQKNNTITNENIRQKQKKCKMYRKIIEKQKQRIAKYQHQQKKLMSKLYTTQKEILKNEHSTSAIKLKINEVRFSQQKKIRSKTRQVKLSEKENIPIGKQKKNMKIEQTQKLKFLHKNHI